MEKIGFNYNPFTWHNIIPEVGDDVTILWGRRYARNLMSSYGALMGTIDLEGDAIFLGLKLSEQFLYPPSVFLLWKQSSDTTWFTPRMGDSKHREVFAAVNASGICIWKNNYMPPIQVIYRIHGV